VNCISSRKPEKAKSRKRTTPPPTDERTNSRLPSALFEDPSCGQAPSEALAGPIPQLDLALHSTTCLLRRRLVVKMAEWHYVLKGAATKRMGGQPTPGAVRRFIYILLFILILLLKRLY